MMVIPVVTPGSFSAQGIDGANGQALWLLVMGAVQMAIGVMWAGQLAVSRFADKLATFALPVLDRSPLVLVGRELFVTKLAAFVTADVRRRGNLDCSCRAESAITMFTFSSNPGVRRRAGIAVAVLALGLFFGGCAAVPTLSQSEFFVRTAPVPMLVQPGREMAMAERAAGEDVRCFALVGAGRSMEPLYASGTAIVVREQHFRTLRAGMAVVYRNRANRYVAHLLVEEMA
eukprot:gene6642-8448_t